MVQNSQALCTVARQHDEITKLRLELGTAQNAAAMQQAQAAGDTAYQESKLLSSMQRRLAAHSEEAANAHRSAEASKAEASACREQLNAATAAHTQERATLAAELTELRGKCELRVRQATEAQEAMQKMEEDAAFTQQQLTSAQASAQQAEQHAAERVQATEQQLAAVQTEAAQLQAQSDQQRSQMQALEQQLQQHVTQVRHKLPCAVGACTKDACSA